MSLMVTILFLTCWIAIAFGNLGNITCCIDWAKCGGQNFTLCTGCCNANYICNKTDDYYSECIPKPLKPMPPAPASAWCGPTGIKMDSSKLKYPGNVTPKEIGEIWAAATTGLTIGRANGGKETCIQAVSIALGECGHPAQSPWMTMDDPACNFGASGNGGVWQITSADGHDTLLAGCSQTEDVCCNARLAYAHAYNQGGATIIPEGYCNAQNDCKQIGSNCGGSGGPPWNDPSVDLKYKIPGALIPNCSYTTNPWYPDGGASLANVTIDQEPCYWGPFSVAAGGVGKEFFPGFFGWGGYFQHYLDSKAGMCDSSPQCGSEINSKCNTGKWATYPSYIDLAISACNAGSFN
eukprot:200332_1